MPMKSQKATVELKVEFLADEYGTDEGRKRTLCRKLRLMEKPASMKFLTPILAEDVTLEEENE